MRQAEAKGAKTLSKLSPKLPLISARSHKYFMGSPLFNLKTIFIVFLALPVANASAMDLNRGKPKSQDMSLTQACNFYLENLSPLNRDAPTNSVLQTKQQNFQSQSTTRPQQETYRESYSEALEAVTTGGAQSLTNPKPSRGKKFSELEQKKMDELDAIAQTLRMREQASKARSQYYNILD